MLSLPRRVAPLSIARVPAAGYWLAMSLAVVARPVPVGQAATAAGGGAFAPAQPRENLGNAKHVSRSPRPALHHVGPPPGRRWLGTGGPKTRPPQRRNQRRRGGERDRPWVRRRGRGGRAAARRRTRAPPRAGARRGAPSPRPGSAAARHSGHTRARQPRTPGAGAGPRASVAGPAPPPPARRPAVASARWPRNSRGSNRRCGRPVAPEASEVVQQLPARALGEPLERQRRAHEVAHQPLQLVPPTRRHRHVRVQAVAIESGARPVRQISRACGPEWQVRYIASRSLSFCRPDPHSCGWAAARHRPSR
jgi:hypothetical protein